MSTAERAALPNALYNEVLPYTVPDAANYAGYSVLVGYIILPALCRTRNNLVRGDKYRAPNGPGD